MLTSGRTSMKSITTGCFGFWSTGLPISGFISLIRRWLQAGVIENGSQDTLHKGHSARSGDLAVAGEYLPALRVRSMGSALA